MALFHFEGTLPVLQIILNIFNRVFNAQVPRCCKNSEWIQSSPDDFPFLRQVRTRESSVVEKSELKVGCGVGRTSKSTNNDLITRFNNFDATLARLFEWWLIEKCLTKALAVFTSDVMDLLSILKGCFSARPRLSGKKFKAFFFPSFSKLTPVINSLKDLSFSVMTDFFRWADWLLHTWTFEGLLVCAALRLSLLRLVFMSSSYCDKKCLHFFTLPVGIHFFAQAKIILPIGLQIRLGCILKSIQLGCNSRSSIAVKSLHPNFLKFHEVFEEEIDYLLGEPKEMSAIIWRWSEPGSSRTERFVRSLISEDSSKRSGVVEVPL